MRRIPFNFDGVDFLWNPANPAFSIMMNSVTFQAIGFEKYICHAMRNAEKFIAGPAILAEACAFNAQEMVHSPSHKKHIKALMEGYPGLQQISDERAQGSCLAWRPSCVQSDQRPCFARGTAGSAHRTETSTA